MKTPVCCFSWCLDQIVDIWKGLGHLKRNQRYSNIEILMLWRNVAITSTLSGFEGIKLTHEQILDRSSPKRDNVPGHSSVAYETRRSNIKSREEWFSAKCVRIPLTLKRQQVQTTVLVNLSVSLIMGCQRSFRSLRGVLASMSWTIAFANVVTTIQNTLYILLCANYLTLSNLIKQSYKKNTLNLTDEKSEAWKVTSFVQTY